MGYWNNTPIDEMDFEIPRPMENIVHETTSAWDQHVMDIDYDVSQALFLVLDTNFLLKHLSLLSAVTNRIIENAHLIPLLFFVLPGVVVDELDYQSKHGVRERATKATVWLQEQIELRLRTGKGALRAQKEDETLRGGQSWRSLRGKGENDNIILDCCLYFAQLSGGQVRLLSHDRNLALKATISDIPVVQVSKESSVTEFMKEIIPGLQLEIPLAATDRSSASSRWASPKSYGVPRVVVPQSSLNLASYDVIQDDDIDMEDMSTSPISYSHHQPAKDMPVYRRLAEDPLENLIKNLQYDDVLTRGAGAIPFPETPRQTLCRISSSIPSQLLYFLSERGEPGYRSGGIRMWSRGDIVSAATALERLFSELGKWDEGEQDQEVKEDKEKARKALVAIVRAFREEEEQRWRASW